jgi:hypothetical protein
MQAHIYQSELEAIGRWTAGWARIETGGELFGYWTHSGAPVVHRSLGPGAASRHEVAAFYQDTDHIEEAQRLLWDQAAMQHIGAWHSHHSLGLATPSGGDERTVWRSMDTLRWPRFLLGICTHGRSVRDVSIGLYLFESARRAITELEVRLLPGEPPGDYRLPHSESGRDPRGDVVIRPRLLAGRESHRRFEAATAAWYSTPDGQERLIREIKGLKVLEEAYGWRSQPVPEGPEIRIKVESPDTTLDVRLGPGFPLVDPIIEGARAEIEYEWSPDLLIAEVLSGPLRGLLDFGEPLPAPPEGVPSLPPDAIVDVTDPKHWADAGDDPVSKNRTALLARTYNKDGSH